MVPLGVRASGTVIPVFDIIATGVAIVPILEVFDRIGIRYVLSLTLALTLHHVLSLWSRIVTWWLLFLVLDIYSIVL